MDLLNIMGVLLEVRLISGAAGKAPVVFLHEGLGSVSLWTQRGLDWPQAVCGATGRAGIVYSRRGYGQSQAALRQTDTVSHPARLSVNYMHQEALEVLPCLLEQLQVEKPVLLGHSDGATIALLYASRFDASACIAMAPHVIVEAVSVKAIAKAKAEFKSGGLKQRLSRHHADIDGAFWQWNDVWLSADFRAFDIRGECQSITAPLLLIQGLDDEYGSLLQLDEIAWAAPHAQQLRLASCGHSPHRDQPDKTIAAIQGFLDSIR